MDSVFPYEWISVSRLTQDWRLVCLNVFESVQAELMYPQHQLSEVWKSDPAGLGVSFGKDV